MEDIEEAPYDPVVGRGQVLIELAEAVDLTKDEVARSFLLSYMEKVFNSVHVSKPKAELVVIRGDRGDGDGAS